MIAAFFKEINGILQEGARLQELRPVIERASIFQFEVLSVGIWTLDFRNGTGCVYAGRCASAAAEPNTTLIAAEKDFVTLMQGAGKATTMALFLSGKVKVVGDIHLFRLLKPLFQELKHRRKQQQQQQVEQQLKWQQEQLAAGGSGAGGSSSSGSSSGGNASSFAAASAAPDAIATAAAPTHLVKIERSGLIAWKSQPEWRADNAVFVCHNCSSAFGLLRRRHVCPP